MRAQQRKRPALLGGLALLSLVVPANAAPPSHSPEACVCHVDGKGGPGERNGSKATNATICVQSFSSATRWCDVTIECMRGVNLPGCTSRSGIISSLPKLYLEHLNFLRQGTPPPANIDGLQKGVGRIDILSRDPPPLLRGCVDAYDRTSAQKPVMSGDVSCGVSDANKWLFIDVELDGSSVRFLFSPRQ